MKFGVWVTKFGKSMGVLMAGDEISSKEDLAEFRFEIDFFCFIWRLRYHL